MVAFSLPSFFCQPLSDCEKTFHGKIGQVSRSYPSGIEDNQRFMWWSVKKDDVFFTDCISILCGCSIFPLMVYSSAANQVNTLTGPKKLDSELNNRLKIADQGEFGRFFSDQVYTRGDFSGFVIVSGFINFSVVSRASKLFASIILVTILRNMALPIIIDCLDL